MNQSAAYNSSADTWSVSLSDMPNPARANFGSTNLNGDVYLMGGYNGAYMVTNQRYEIASDLWSTREDLPTPSRADHLVVGDNNNTVYVVDGYNASGNISDLDKYDAITNSWDTSLNNATITRSSVSGIFYSDHIYVANGYDGTSEIDTLEMYDATSDSWSTLTNSGISRRDSAYSLIDTDKMIIAGGIASGSYLRNTQVYDTSSDSWSSVTDIPLPARTDATGAVYSNTYFELVGGFDGSYYLRDNDQYDYTTDSWSAKINTPSPGREDLTGVNVN